MSVSFSVNGPTHDRFPMTEVVSQTRHLPVSAIVVPFSLFSIAKTLPLFSTKTNQTNLLPFSQTCIPTDLSISVAVVLSHPHDVNPDRWSPQWNASNRMKLSIFPLPKSQSQFLKTLIGFRSNLFLLSLSYLPSNLSPTFDFLEDTNADLKVSSVSLKINSNALSGGFGALFAIVCLCAFLYRRNRQNELEIEDEVYDALDLPTEHSDAEEENSFDLENGNGEDLEDPFDSETLEFDGIPGGRHLRMHFDGEESFQSFQFSSPVMEHRRDG
jgi:hypothetical protein